MNFQLNPGRIHPQPVELIEDLDNTDDHIPQEENLDDHESPRHNLPHTTVYPQNNLFHRGPAPASFSQKLFGCVTKCCRKSIRTITHNRFGSFICMLLLFFFIRVSRVLNDDVLFWLTFIPTIVILIVAVCHFCIAAHRARMQFYREATQRLPISSTMNNRLMEQVLLATLRQRLETLMLANRQRLRLMGVNVAHGPRMHEGLNSREFLRQILNELGIFEHTHQRQRGLSEQEINNVPVEIFEGQTTEGGEPEICSICIDEFKAGQELRKMPTCTHRFHKNCVDEWLKISNACPNCKGEINRNQSQNQNQNQNHNPFLNPIDQV